MTLSPNQKEHRVGVRAGHCKCGAAFGGHSRCEECGVLSHSDKKWCEIEGSPVLVGYIPTGKVCYNCKQDIKAKKRRDPKYLAKLARQRAATRKFYLKNRARLNEAARERAKANRRKMWLVAKQRILSDPVEQQRRREWLRDFSKKHPGYHTVAQRNERKAKRLEEAYTKEEEIVGVEHGQGGQGVQLMDSSAGRQMPVPDVHTEGHQEAPMQPLRGEETLSDQV